MTPDRTRELLEAYGADRARWPHDEARLDAGKTRTDGDAVDLEHARSEAGRLDGLLNLYEVAPAPGSLRASILALPVEAVDVRDVARIRPDMRKPGWSLAGGMTGVLNGLFPKLAGLVLASVLGFMVGAADLLPVHDRSVSVDVSGLALGEDGLGGFDS